MVRARRRQTQDAVTDATWTSNIEKWTLRSLLERRLAQDADSEYLDVCGTRLTAGEVSQTGNRVANALIDLSVQPGDRVAILIENSAEAVVAWWGTVLAGAISVPVNTAYKGEYLRHQLHDAGAKVLIVDSSLVDRVAQIAAKLEHLTHVVVIGESNVDIPRQVVDWDHIMGSDSSPPQITPVAADLATFVYTGGTTGPSKGCMLSHNYHAAITAQIGTCWERTAQDVLWTPLPLFHFNAITTAVVGPLLFGGRAAIYRRFSVSAFWTESSQSMSALMWPSCTMNCPGPVSPCTHDARMRSSGTCSWIRQMANSSRGSGRSVF